MAFEKLAWIRHTNIYEVNLRQYTKEGTFAAFIRHIPRLKDMGIHTLWFMPVTPISQLKRKGTLGSYYACSDYTTVNPEFGTLAEFRELVSYAHQQGMKVIIDWVANHTGADHVWTISRPDFFHRNAEGQFYDKHGWEDVIDLDYSNLEMRLEMIRAMEFWIRECNIDGFRCDMAMLVPLDFWHQARTALDQVKPLFWLAETDQWNDPLFLEVFDAAYTWKWMHVSQEFARGLKPITELKEVLQIYNTMHPSDSLKAWFTSNHDENSWNGTEYEKYGPLALPLVVFSCLWNGIPLIYSGQELPNTKRLAFFDKDEIEWSENVQLHGLYKELLNLRVLNPALEAGSESWLVYTDHADKVLCFCRRFAGNEVLVMLNLSQWPLDVQVYEHHRPLDAYITLNSVQTLISGLNTKVILPAYGYALFKLDV